MFYQNNIFYTLTGTQFGFLSSYPEVSYKDSYLLTDLFNRPYEGYNETLTGNGFFKPFGSDLIANIPDIGLWLDFTDPATYRYNRSSTSLISAIVDKSDNDYVFRRYLDTPSVPCFEWYFGRMRDSNMRLTSLAFGEGRFIACAVNSTYFARTTSINEYSVDWDRTGTVNSDQYVDIAYGDTSSQGKCFVAVSSASNNYVISRDGGTTWTSNSYPVAIAGVKGIAYGGDKFVVISNNQSLYWSTNSVGTNFIQGNNFPAGNWNRVIYGNGKFIVFGNSDKIAISNNGIGWNTVTLPVTTNITAGTYGDNKFILTGGVDTLIIGVSSSNGENNTWAEIFTIAANNVGAAPVSLSYSTLRNQYVLVFDRGSSGSYSTIQYSNDGGDVWKQITLPSVYDFKKIANGKNEFDIDLFIGVGNSNTDRVAILSCMYHRSEPVTTRQWPVTCFDYTNKNGIIFTKNKALFNKDFYLDLSKTHTMYMVWKDLNIYNNTIPFGFNTVYNDLTGELILKRDYNYLDTPGLPQGSLGIRGSEVGYRIETFNNLLSSNNITLWEKTTADFLSSGNVFSINNNYINLSSYFNTSKDTILEGSKVGYLSGNNENNFILSEVIIFDRILNGDEKGLISNYLSNKYCFPYYFENLVYPNELSGGPLANISYEDYSVLTSIITLPVQSCVTLLTISLSSFEMSKSKINKVVYDCGDVYGSIDATYGVDSGNRFLQFNRDNNLQFYVVPGNDVTFQSYFVYLSVFRNDTTVNKIILSGTLLKCGIMDLYNKNKFVDSQIIDSSKDLLLVTENLNRNMLYISKLNVEVPVPSLSGGEEQPLINVDYSDVEDDVILLSDLIEDKVVEKFRRPFFVPVPAPRSNPIRPE